MLNFLFQKDSVAAIHHRPKNADQITINRFVITAASIRDTHKCHSTQAVFLFCFGVVGLLQSKERKGKERGKGTDLTATANNLLKVMVSTPTIVPMISVKNPGGRVANGGFVEGKGKKSEA